MNRGTVTRHETGAVGGGITQQLAQTVASAAGKVHEAWAVTDTGRRVTLLADICADDVAYANPLRNCRGVQALSELISELTAAYPGYLPTRTSGVDAHHDAARYEWALRDRAGQTVLAGIEIVHFTPGGRLTSIVSFFGQPPAIRYTYQA
ncbi:MULTISPECIES: hypothetical protein [Pseudofrankia]|uniref:hypothetical protein n=1 Tax=Pseudofrankia TaxID=2994363 RepID=UPI000234DB17|nr:MULTISPECIES: hypothetical protein [Pseudofrankia]OHV31772.1 hypothetical protein BCD49_05640 [Pseudofrankia sp. EUN1h]